MSEIVVTFVEKLNSHGEERECRHQANTSAIRRSTYYRLQPQLLFLVQLNLGLNLVEFPAIKVLVLVRPVYPFENLFAILIAAFEGEPTG